MGWCIVHPFNTLAVRINLASMNPGAAPKPFVSYASELIATEGVSLYAGLGAGCLRQIFYATSRYGLFETFRDAAAKYRETDFAQRFTLASVAGGAPPSSRARWRCASCGCRTTRQPAAEQRGYKSVFDAFGRIMGEEGFGAFYRGSQPFVMRAMVVGGTQVATYDQFKIFFASLGVPAGVGNTFFSAFSAGLLYSVITMPLETAKNQMAFQKPDPKTGQLPYTGTAQTIASIARTEGTLALWNGFFPYYGRCGGHTVTMFFFVEENPQDLPTIPRLSARRRGRRRPRGRGGVCPLIVITCDLSSQAGRRPFSISK